MIKRFRCSLITHLYSSPRAEALASARDREGSSAPQAEVAAGWPPSRVGKQVNYSRLAPNLQTLRGRRRSIRL
jgi:hypothetical protein